MGEMKEGAGGVTAWLKDGGRQQWTATTGSEAHSSTAPTSSQFPLFCRATLIELQAPLPSSVPLLMPNSGSACLSHGEKKKNLLFKVQQLWHFKQWEGWMSNVSHCNFKKQMSNLSYGVRIFCILVLFIIIVYSRPPWGTVSSSKETQCS